MPWQCQQCQKQVMDDEATCPTCSQSKGAWTVVPDKTRDMVIQAKKFAFLCAEEKDPLAAGASYAQAMWKPTEEARVLAKADALELAKQKQQPAPRHVVAVRVTPRKDKDWTITLTPKLAKGKIQDQTFPQTGATLTPEGTFDARFVFVCGKEDVSQLTFPDAQVLDVSDESATGFAPTVDAVAVKKKKKPLQLVVDPIDVELVDPQGAPVKGQQVQFELRDGTVKELQTDASGKAQLSGFAALSVSLPIDGALWERAS